MELPVHCELCPRRCGADRRAGAGFCGAGATLKAARAALPRYMVPNLYHPLETMPHNPNGKIDRPRLQDAIFRKKVLIP